MPQGQLVFSQVIGGVVVAAISNLRRAVSRRSQNHLKPLGSSSRPCGRRARRLAAYLVINCLPLMDAIDSRIDIVRGWNKY
jgi:hypothetical protein